MGMGGVGIISLSPYERRPHQFSETRLPEIPILGNPLSPDPIGQAFSRGSYPLPAGPGYPYRASGPFVSTGLVPTKQRSGHD